MIQEYYSSLTKATKSAFYLFILGVVVAGSLTLYSRHMLSQATEKEKKANELHGQYELLQKEAADLKKIGDGLAADLKKADVKVAKLQAIVDKIKVPEKPGPAPAEKKRLLDDLRGMGLELVVKPSTTIAPSLVGITGRDGQAIWGWGKENLRVPFLEQKIDALTNYSAGLEKAKGVAEKLADSRTKEADVALKSADKANQEAVMMREVAEDVKKALAAEKKRKYLYMVGAAAGGYFVGKQLTK